MDDLGGRRVRVRGLRGCRPAFFLDGMPFRPLPDESIDDYVVPGSIVAIEVYMGGPAPLQYGSCSIVIWTGFVDGK